jgi:hypothetical protein
MFFISVLSHKGDISDNLVILSPETRQIGQGWLLLVPRVREITHLKSSTLEIDKDEYKVHTAFHNWQI